VRWLGYAWTVAVNCFYLIVIGWVFDKLHGHHELTITVAILGLIYVTVRTIGMYQFHASLDLFKLTRRQLLQLQKRAGDPSYEANQKELDEVDELHQKNMVKFYINAFFLWLIGIICMLILFTTLDSMPSPY
jgi:hypothetical protein